MKIVIQKVKEAKVIVEQEVVGEIKQGYMLLVGMETGDTDADINKAVDKIASIRLFDDADGKINLSIQDVGGGDIIHFSIYISCGLS